MNKQDPEHLPFVDGVDAATALDHHLCRRAVLLSARVREAKTKEERSTYQTQLQEVEAEIAKRRRARKQASEDQDSIR
ncbi:MAG: hypothetical protein JXA87_12405 [Thermoleophilia bacterium]|nr:hypothetical protein [Thermoleophilia bacterium]